MSSFYTRQFWLLCISNFLFTASFQMMLPELPGMLKAMNGINYIGLSIALFTLTAGISRPFSGKLVDTVGRVPIMVLGSLVCVVASGMYPFVHSILAFCVLRFFHGFSTGTKPTATAAYIADVAPVQQRGEASGALAIFTSLGFSVGPFVGGLFSAQWGLNAMFVASSVFALLSVIILGNIKETLPKPQKFKFSILKLNLSDLFDPKVKVVFWVMLYLSFSTGIIITLVPDHSLHVGYTNKGLFFSIYTLSSLGVRILFSKTSDRLGRAPVLVCTTVVLMVSMLCMYLANSPLLFILGGITFGMATGMCTPTLIAWAIDLSHEQQRGRALSTVYMALEAGIGLGAIVGGFMYQGNIQNLLLAYLFSGLVASFSLVSMYIYKNKSAQK
jgi:MFS family permease